MYLGAVDETAHLVGSATPDYRNSIDLADKRLGVLLNAIRDRATYGMERWTVIVTTDHGQQDLASPSPFSHGGPSDLERTSFMFAAGPGVAQGSSRVAGVVDVAPTVLHQLGLAVQPGWNLDGRSFVAGGAPPARPAARVRLRSRRPALELVAEAASRAPALASVRLRLSRSVTLRSAARARVNGRRVGRSRLRVPTTACVSRCRPGPAAAGPGSASPDAAEASAHRRGDHRRGRRRRTGPPHRRARPAVGSRPCT